MICILQRTQKWKQRVRPPRIDHCEAVTFSFLPSRFPIRQLAIVQKQTQKTHKRGEVMRIKAYRPSWRAWHSGSLHPLQKKRTSVQPLQQRRAWTHERKRTIRSDPVSFSCSLLADGGCMQMYSRANVTFKKARPTYKMLLSIFPMGLYFRFCWELSWIKSDTSFSI